MTRIDLKARCFPPVRERAREAERIAQARNDDTVPVPNEGPAMHDVEPASTKTALQSAENEGWNTECAVARQLRRPRSGVAFRRSGKPPNMR